MPTSTRPVAFTLFAACALFVSACGGGDDDAATSTAPELTGRQGQCGVHYPVIPAGKTFELNYQTDKDGQWAAMAASGTGFPTDGSYELRLKPGMGIQVRGQLMESSWCVQALSTASGDTVSSYWPGATVTGSTFADPGYLVSGFSVRSDWVSNPQQVFFDVKASSGRDPQDMDICRATAYGPGSLTVECVRPEVTRTASGWTVSSVLTGTERAPLATVMLVSSKRP